MVELAITLFCIGLLVGVAGLSAMTYGITDAVKDKVKKSFCDFFIAFATIVALITICVGVIMGGIILTNMAHKEADHKSQCHSISDSTYSSGGDACYKNGEDISPWR